MECWQWLFLQSWRLPEPDRNAVMEQARRLAGTDETGSPGALVPSCEVFHHEGLWTDTAVPPALSEGGPVVGKLARTLEELLTVAESCPDLRLLFRSDDPAPTAGNTKTMAAYREKVLSYAPLARGDRLELGRLLFEGIGSLCPWPLPAEDSLWNRRVQEAIHDVEALQDRAQQRLIIPGAPGMASRQTPPKVVSIFSPEEQPKDRVWPLRIGVQGNGGIDPSDEPRLLEAKANC